MRIPSTARSSIWNVSSSPATYPRSTFSTGAGQGDEAALHRAAAPRVRAVGAPAGPLLPLRGVDARPLVRGRAHVPDLPGRTPVGGRADGPHRPDRQAADPARRRCRLVAPVDDELV